MSRITKWKLEKTKVKVVFRLQFHATHIPQTGWDKLFISFIPADSGKATSKTTKANVRNGTCRWADPIYETTRLLQDVKSKQYDDKLYKLVVAMGSSRSSVLGEAIINLAEYADALKPTVVALPLHLCNAGTTLHVTVQLLTSKTGFREFEQQRELRDRGFQTGDKHDGGSPSKAVSLDDIAADRMEKVSARVRSTSDARELSSVEEDAINEEYADSAVGFEGSSNTSESLYTERHDASSTNEIESHKGKVVGNMNEVHHPSPQTHKRDPSDSQNMAHGSIDSVQGWSSDYSMDNDLAIAFEENNRLRGNLELAESSIFEVKKEVTSLQSQADEISTETEKFSCILATEISTSEELAKEVSLLRMECSQYKDDIDRLKSIKLSHQGQVQLYRLVEDIQLRWVKGILVVEDRIKELHSKTYLGFDERDSRFLHSELEALLNALQDLKHGTGKAISSLNVISAERNVVKDTRELSLQGSEQFSSGTELDLEVCEPEIMLQHFNIPPLVSQETDSVSAMEAMKKNLFDLIRELDEAKIEREGLARKMGQMECYYEALIQELEENQKHMLGELQNLRNEHSTCLYKISTNKVEMETMRHEMNEQILRLAEEGRDLDALNKELERRAATSETALRRARLNYSIAVDKLQKDLELLSSQVVSMFETNENVIKQAFSETSQPSCCGYQNITQNSEDSDAMQPLQFPNQTMGVRRQLGGDILLEDLKISLSLQEELYKKVEEELSEMHFGNLHLDIFSKALQETLCEANADLILVKMEMDELVEQLRLSNESKDLLIVRLQAAMGDVHNLSEYKVSCTAQYNDIAFQNQILEAKLEGLSKENSLLVEKVTEMEAMVMKYRSYQSQYEVCFSEKTELSNLLAQEASVASKLQNEKSILNEELVVLQAKVFELTSLKENLEETVSSVHRQLASLLSSSQKQLSGVSLSTDTHALECKGVMLLLEEIQHIACSKIFQLVEENNDLENERLAAVASLSAVRSEFLAMKKKFKLNIQDMMAKLDVSNAIVENFQVNLESVANKLLHSSEVEAKFVEKHGELLADLSILEVELQKLLSEDGQLVQEISGMKTLSVELERSKLTIAELMQEKQDLFMSLHDKTVESAKLASEFSHLKENLRSLQDELDTERGTKDKLESAIGDLTSQLNVEQNKVHDCEQQKAELEYLRQLSADLELDNSRLNGLLLQRDKFVQKLQAQSSSVTGLESQLLEMHDHVITADVKIAFFTSLYDTRIEELEQKLRSSDMCFRELQLKHHELEAMLNCSLAKESHYAEENSSLIKSIESTRSELETSLAQNRVVSEANTCIMVELDEYKRKLAALEVRISEDKDRHMYESEQLKYNLSSAEEEIINLTLSKEQLEISTILLLGKLEEQLGCSSLLEECEDELMALRAKCNELSKFKNNLATAEEEIINLTLSEEQLEITIILLKGKLQDQHAYSMLLGKCEDELMTLRAHCIELSQKLSEQTLRTQEFKNLSIHLKELKDKADAECLAREKREPEAPSAAMQESLRIAFIKEQYETKLQELKQQLSISKKHGEDMLLKLQDAVDEIENRKRSEALHSKRNEELALKLLALEDELQSLLSDNREKIKACDCLKAELECAILSLECCKEEKEKLETSLQECEKEKSRIAAELSLTKRQLEDIASSVISCEEESGAKDEARHPPVELTGNCFHNSSHPDGLMHGEKLQRSEASNEDTEAQALQEDAAHKGLHQIPEKGVLGGDLQQTNGNHLFHDLKSSIKHLHEELERMKKENSLIPDDHHFDSDYQVLQNEISRLDKVNEELRSIFPMYSEISSTGNAFERVLALEIELAEALRAKHKSKIHFQSSFLKQHSDEESVLKSFRDINELIKEMLELKGKYAAVEAELKEMHDRYSQLSLEFAEVEGDRQKLKMTLKNVRASRKQMQLNRSSSAANAEPSS